jgi:hypothetical protein
MTLRLIIPLREAKKLKDPLAALIVSVLAEDLTEDTQELVR